MRIGLVTVLQWAEKFALRTCQLAVILMTALVLIQVVLRYFVGDALVWAEEGSVFLMIWVTFFGAGIAYRRGAHVAVTILPDRLPRSVARALVLFSHVLILVFLAIVAWQGWELSQSAVGQLSAGLGVSMKWPYLMVPFGCILLTAQVVAAMIDPRDN